MPEWRPQGYVPNPKENDRIVASLKHPTMASAGPKLKTDDKRDVVLWPSIIKVRPNYARVAQAIGSCVGHAYAGGIDALSCTEIVIHGEAEDWPGRCLEASIYGFSRVEARGLKRNSGGDGSFGGAAAKALLQYGCLHYDVDYNGTVFSEYSGIREKTWGATGVPDELEPFAKKRRIKDATLLESYEDLEKAISSGYPCVLCSGQGFTLSRTEGGWAKPRGQWLHAMTAIGKRVGARPGALIWNSWGNKAHSGPHYSGVPGQEMPKEFLGSTFWADAEVVDQMIRSWRDSFAISGYDGFPPRKLPSWTKGVT